MEHLQQLESKVTKSMPKLSDRDCNGFRRILEHLDALLLYDQLKFGRTSLVHQKRQMHTTNKSNIHVSIRKINPLDMT